jgi:basic membrane lipoprotein Med (substrate-binding protein (PBP1-ABC) superfamily)
MGQDRRPTAVKERATRAPSPTGWRARMPHGLRELRGWRFAVAVAAVVAAATVAVWALIATSGPEPRARHYLAFKACLLTDAQGVAGKEAAPVWSGMEKASVKTHAKVQSLPAFGPPTTANTQPYLRTLISQSCDVIVAVGAGPVASVVTEAPAHPKTHFILVGEAPAAHNLTVVPPGSNESKAISDTLIQLVRAG